MPFDERVPRVGVSGYAPSLLLSLLEPDTSLRSARVPLCLQLARRLQSESFWRLFSSSTRLMVWDLLKGCCRCRAQGPSSRTGLSQWLWPGDSPHNPVKTLHCNHLRQYFRVTVLTNGTTYLWRFSCESCLSVRTLVQLVFFCCGASQRHTRWQFGE